MGDLVSQPEKSVPIKSEQRATQTTVGSLSVDNSQSLDSLGGVVKPQESRGGTIPSLVNNNHPITFQHTSLGEDVTTLDADRRQRAQDPELQARHEQAVRDNVAWNKSEAEKIFAEQKAKMERIKQKLLGQKVISAQTALQFIVEPPITQPNLRAAGGIEFVVNRQMPPEFAHLWNEEVAEAVLENMQSSSDQQKEDGVGILKRASRENFAMIQDGKVLRRPQMPPLRQREVTVPLNDVSKMAA